MLAPSRVLRTLGRKIVRDEADNNPNMPLIVDLAAKARLPAIYPNRESACLKRAISDIAV
jgi:hypothetical protein